MVKQKQNTLFQIPGDQRDAILARTKERLEAFDTEEGSVSAQVIAARRALEEGDLLTPIIDAKLGITLRMARQFDLAMASPGGITVAAANTFKTIIETLDTLPLAGSVTESGFDSLQLTLEKLTIDALKKSRKSEAA